MKQRVRCGEATGEQVHETVTADVCPAGRGLWFDERELEQREAWAEQRAAPGSAESIASGEQVDAREHGDKEIIENRPCIFSWLGAVLKH